MQSIESGLSTSAAGPHGKLYIFLIVNISLAEGVVSEPFLPSGDHGHKVGFATLPKLSIVGRNADKIPSKDKPFQRNIGLKTWREHRNFEKLGTRLDTPKPPILGETSRIA